MTCFPWNHTGLFFLTNIRLTRLKIQPYCTKKNKKISGLWLGHTQQHSITCSIYTLWGIWDSGTQLLLLLLLLANTVISIQLTLALPLLICCLIGPGLIMSPLSLPHMFNVIRLNMRLLGDHFDTWMIICLVHNLADKVCHDTGVMILSEEIVQSAWYVTV